MNRKVKMILGFIVCCSVWSSSYSQNDSKDHDGDHKHAHKNHIALFNGGTTNFTHHSTNYTLGLDYEYRINNYFGIGLLGEYIAIDKGEFIGGIPVFVHFANDFNLIATPLLINKADHHNEDSHHTELHRNTTFSFRLGMSYSFHIVNFSLSPSVSFDIGESKSLIYGISIGTGF